MRILLSLLLALAAMPCYAVDKIIATLSVTNFPTTNGQTITVNGNVRTFTNNVVLTSVQVGTNATAAGSKTNLYNQIALFPFTQIVLVDKGSTNFDIAASSGVALTVTLSAGWGTVSYATQTVATSVAVRVPYGIEAGAQQTNITSGIVAMVGASANTNSIPASALSMANFGTLATAQTVSGAKNFTSTTSEYYGYVSNATKISGNVDTLTNGTWRTGILISPTLTNGVNYGNAFRSPGSGTTSEQFGSGAIATGDYSVAIGQGAGSVGNYSIALGQTADADGVASIAIGQGAVANSDYSISIGSTLVGPNSTAIGLFSQADNTTSTAIGYSAQTTTDSQIRIGSSTEYVSIPGNLKVEGNSEIRWARFPITTLANGNNAGIAVGTNTFIEVSGPSAAFNINGIAGGSDGKFLIILNQTTYNMTIAHDSGTDPTAANRIYSMTGADRATTGNGAALLIYSGAASRWILISLDL